VGAFALTLIFLGCALALAKAEKHISPLDDVRFPRLAFREATEMARPPMTFI